MGEKKKSWIETLKESKVKQSVNCRSFESVKCKSVKKKTDITQIIDDDCFLGIMMSCKERLGRLVGR